MAPVAADKTVLSVKGLQAWYNELQILHGVDLDVREGEVVTLWTERSRQDDNAEGDHGHRPQANRLDRIRRQGAYRPLDRPHRPTWRRILPRGAGHIRLALGQGEFVSSASDRQTRGDQPVEHIFQLFPNLRERLMSGGGKLSGGEQQMLAIARILRTGARFLMLDEPTESLAPVIIQQIGRTIAELKREGFTILLVEQNFRFASTWPIGSSMMSMRIIDAFANSELEGRMDRLHEALEVTMNEIRRPACPHPSPSPRPERRALRNALWERGSTLLLPGEGGERSSPDEGRAP